jgi:outer membrane lipoprotein SlyB
MKRFLTLGIATLSMIFAGCETKTGTGTLAGAGLGAVAGGAIGGGKGALIGGAVGAAAGGLVGASLDEQDRKVMQKTSPRTVDRMDRREPLTVNDVIKLSQGGVSDESIIRYLQQTGSTYNLSQAQIRRLQDAGVSQRVVNYMVDSSR